MKNISLLTVALFLSTGWAFANEGMMHGQAGQGMMCKRMMHHGMMEKSQMVATTDGGVVVKMGNKLLKYDKNLKLVKEVELNVDMGHMYPMKGKMMGGENGTPPPSPVPQPPAPAGN